MSPAAGGPAPAQSAPESDRAPPPRRDPTEGADPANAATRKTAWGMMAPPPVTAAPTPAGTPDGGIIGGDALWPALADSARARPTSASSDSLKSHSDGSGPSTQEESVASSVPPHVDINPISTASNPTHEPPPDVAPDIAATPSSQQNGATAQTSPGTRSGSTGGKNGGGGRRAANSNGADRSSGRGGDGNWNQGSPGTRSSHNSNNVAGSSSLNDSFPGDDISGNGSDRSKNSISNNNWNNSIRGVGGSSSNGSGRGDGNNRNSGGRNNHWNNNARNNSGSGNAPGGRGAYRSRRDHERGGNFSPRSYPNIPVMPYQQQPPPSVYQPGPFHGPPPPPIGHMMMPQHFMAYAPPFAYHADMQSYPLYHPPVEQFQNMHLVRPPMQPAFVPQDQLNLQEHIRTQIEFYFSTNNLCHDTYLRRKMNDQGWVPIDLILGFNRMRAYTGMVDTNYILNAIRGSEILELQGDNVRRRNDWAEWILH